MKRVLNIQALPKFGAKFYENATEGKVVKKLLFHKRRACIIK
jgi:hypothetical protein